jgi:ribonucleoside-diphosphate reductase alpha chain
LRPRGAQANGVGLVASGPVSFMGIWDRMCATILSTGARRGAMMGTLHCDHPDIEEFIAAKQDRNQLRHFNISVLISDAFMTAVSQDDDWPLIFPAGKYADSGEITMRNWPGYANPVPCKLYKRIRARVLWEKIMRAAYDYAEPGVLFIDRINQFNNLYYCETIQATNPCGEVPLPPYGACNLGSINLTQFVRDPFTAQRDLI